MKRKVLVIGGAGYIGSVLTRLLSSTYKVYVVDTMWFWDSDLPLPKSITQYKCKPHETPSLVQRLLEEYDIYGVVNLAAISNDICADIDGKFTNFNNYRIPRRVFDIVNRTQGIKHFIHFSSGSVYGVTKDPATELSPCDPITQYADLKLALDDYILSRRSDDKNVVILRPATVVGPSPRQRNDLVLNAMCYAVAQKQVFRVDGGTQIRPFVYIDDLCNVVRAILQEKISSEVGILNVQAKLAYKIIDYAALAQSIIGLQYVVDHNVADQRSWFMSSSSCIDEIVTHNLNDALVKTLAHYLKLSPDDLKYSYNIQVLKSLVPQYMDSYDIS